MSRLFRRLFIANRGEVAARVARTCRRLGIEPVFGVSAADRDAPWTRRPDGSAHEQVVLGPARASESYLAREHVVQAASQSRCTALHPGWGFLAEDPVFASLCEQHGVTFIGPTPGVMSLMAKKTPAKRTMAAHGLRTIPGSDGVLTGGEQALALAIEVGLPVLLKAESGGGGRGMRVVREAAEVEEAFADAQAEALANFGDERVYLEKLVEGGRHVEVQVLADRFGNVVHLGERDCSVQRNHQKLIEEAPAPTLSEDERARTLAAAVEATRRLGYVGAGTIELLMMADGTLRFMEMNTRLQVEHPVSEVRTRIKSAGGLAALGTIDLVEEQIRVAAGQALRFRQEDLLFSGHSIECRINAEDPARGFRPAPGLIESWTLPRGEGVRVDTHVEAGYRVPPHYDSLLCKIIAHGKDRAEAIARMRAALDGFECKGLPTTAGMHAQVVASEAFRTGDYDTRTIPGWTAPGDERPATDAETEES